MWNFFFLAIIFLLLGLAVHKFKMYFLISGYNTMPKAAQANVDTQGLGRLMGIYGYINGGLFIIFGILNAVGIETTMIPAIFLIMGSTVLLLVKSRKYDLNIYDRSGRMRKGAGKKIVAPTIISLATIVFVAVVLFFSVKPTVVTPLVDGIKIHGIYGETIPWSSIEDIRLDETLPTIEIRTNGSGVGSHLKGHFRTTKMGSVKLFVRANKPPFIYIFRADEKPIIFNMKSAENTNMIYQDMLAKWEH